MVTAAASASRASREALLPPPALRHSRDSRRLHPVWCPAGTAGVGADNGLRPETRPHLAAAASDATALGTEPRRASELRKDLVLPDRELSVDATIEALRRLRRHRGLFANLPLADVDDIARVCSPLAFARSEVLFKRGEVATWFGVFLSGEAVASLPREDPRDEEILLGRHGEGQVIGITRTSLWKRSHVRAYTLRGTSGGYVAVLSYDQLEEMYSRRPRLHCAVLEMLLGVLADSAAGFFRGCPLSCGIRWPLVDFNERRVLDYLVHLRDAGQLLVGVGYQALVALACRLPIAQFEARSSVLSRGTPLTAALLVLDGKLTGFRDAGGPPSTWFEPGDFVGLECVVGSVRPCQLDVFAARPTIAALLVPSELEDLRREFPNFASQVLRSIYKKFFSELSEPHGEALMLLAEASTRMHYLPGEAPAMPPPRRRFPGTLTPENAAAALKLAESTAPSWWRGPVGAMHMHNSADSDDKHVAVPAPEILLGNFLSRKLVERQVQLPPRRRAVANGGYKAGELVATSAATPSSSSQLAATGLGRPLSAPPLSRFHPDLVGVVSEGAQRRPNGAVSATDLVKLAQGIDVLAMEIDPNAPTAPPSTALRRALSSSRGLWRSREIALAASARKLRDSTRSPNEENPEAPIWLPVGRPRSAPPPRLNDPFVDTSSSDRTLKQTTLQTKGVRAGVKDLLHLRQRRNHVASKSEYCGAHTCPSCGASLRRDTDAMMETTASAATMTAGIQSSGRDHGNSVDIFVGGRRVPLSTGRHCEMSRGCSLISGVDFRNGRSGAGLHVVTLDTAQRPPRVLSTWNYDTTGASADLDAANAQLVADLGALPDGRVVLVALRGSGLEGLNREAVRSLVSVGATPLAIGNGRPHEGYALIGRKGGRAISERQGRRVEVEGVLPPSRRDGDPVVATVTEDHDRTLRVKALLELQHGDLSAAFSYIDDNNRKHVTLTELTRALDQVGVPRSVSEAVFRHLLELSHCKMQGALTLSTWLNGFAKASADGGSITDAGAVAQPPAHPRFRGEEADSDNGMRWYLDQQRRFLSDVRTQEETVSADQHQAWNLKILGLQDDMARMQIRIKDLEASNAKLQEEAALAVKERDEWRATTLRMQLNREFKTTAESLEADHARFLKPTCGSAMPDFSHSLQQQLALAATPLQLLSADGIVDHTATDHRPPPALRTFPRGPSLGQY